MMVCKLICRLAVFRFDLGPATSRCHWRRSYQQPSWTAAAYHASVMIIIL